VLSGVGDASDHQHQQQPRTAFDFEEGMQSSLPIERYVRRWVLAKITCSEETCTAALVLMDRFAAHAGIPITADNVFRLFACGIVVAWKLQEDRYYTNKVPFPHH
jgi:hypothetical protein